MQLESHIVTAMVTAALTSAYFVLGRRNQLLDQKRKAGTKFLARINECLIDAKTAGMDGLQCICHESYAEFRLTLEGQEATDLELCWNDYITKRTRGERCIECLECLHRLVHKYTRSGGKSEVPACPTCAAQ